MPPLRGIALFFYAYVKLLKQILSILESAEVTEKKKTIYRLYALSLADTTERAIEQYRFCRVTTFYTLVYTADETPPENSIVIDGEDVERLSSADRDWLLGCNMTLIAEDMKDREKEITANLSEKIEKLEQALEQAKRTGGQNQ